MQLARSSCLAIGLLSVLVDFSNGHFFANNTAIATQATSTEVISTAISSTAASHTTVPDEDDSIASSVAASSDVTNTPAASSSAIISAAASSSIATSSDLINMSAATSVQISSAAVSTSVASGSAAMSSSGTATSTVTPNGSEDDNDDQSGDDDDDDDADEDNDIDSSDEDENEPDSDDGTESGDDNTGPSDDSTGLGTGLGIGSGTGSSTGSHTGSGTGTGSGLGTGSGTGSGSGSNNHDDGGSNDDDDGGSDDSDGGGSGDDDVKTTVSEPTSETTSEATSEATQTKSESPSESASETTSETTSEATSETTSTTTSTTSSPSSSCTVTNTVSNCAVHCASTTSGSSCASYSTTCSQTSTGCSAEGTTTTVSSSVCQETFPSWIWKATGVFCGSSCGIKKRDLGMNTAAITSPPRVMPSGMLDRLQARPLSLEKRRGRPIDKASIIKKLGTCVLEAPNGIPLTFPAYPSVTPEMLKPDAAGNMEAKYSHISRWDRATWTECGPLTTTRLSAQEYLDAPKDWKYKHGTDRRDQTTNNDASLDHAYEKQWLKAFFISVIGDDSVEGKLSCTNINKFFFPKSGECGHNLLSDAFNAVAGNSNLDFVAMSAFLNGARGKGQFFETEPLKWMRKDTLLKISDDLSGWSWTGTGDTKSAADELRKQLGIFEKRLYGVLELNTDNMFELIKKTNLKIYSQLQVLDSIVEQNPERLLGDTSAYYTAFPDGIAAKYRTYMTSTVAQEINEPAAWLSSLWRDTIFYNLNAAQNLKEVQNDDTSRKEYQEIAAEFYLHNTHYLVDANDWSWSQTTGSMFEFTWEDDDSETEENTGTEPNSNTKRDVSELLKRAQACGAAGSATSGASSETTSDASSESSAAASSSAAATIG